MTMIEKVARAIEVEFVKSRSTSSDVARAAITAMREPTDEMLEAGFKKKSYTKETWQAMIDAALKETK